MIKSDIQTPSTTPTSVRGSRLSKVLRVLAASYVSQYEIAGVDPSARLRWTPVV